MQNAASWTTDPLGVAGTSPANFTSGNQIFHTGQNSITSATISGSWTVSGTGSKIIVGDGGTNTLTIPSAFALTTTSPVVVDVAATGTLVFQNASIPTLGTLATTSTVNYNNAGNQTVSAQTYGNLTISNSGTKTLGGATTVSTTLDLTGATLAAASNLTMGLAGTPLITRSEGAMTGTLQGTNDFDVTYTGNTKTTGPELNNNGLRNIAVGLTAGQSLTLDANRSPDGDLSVTHRNF